MPTKITKKQIAEKYKNILNVEMDMLTRGIKHMNLDYFHNITDVECIEEAIEAFQMIKDRTDNIENQLQKALNDLKTGKTGILALKKS